MLFEPFTLRQVTFRNRIVVSPMRQYSYEDGFSNDWQLVHLGSRAVGGAGLVFAEAAAVEARGRISPGDLGIWTDEHVAPLQRVTRFIASQGARRPREFLGSRTNPCEKRTAVGRSRIPWNWRKSSIKKE
jgi:2,4-dienoyl-CoA reductase-like NADH-dependent reductase (Old Yellow Enzyme family)